MDKGLDISAQRELLACHAALHARPFGARGLPAPSRSPWTVHDTLAVLRRHAGTPDWAAAERALAWAAAPDRHILVYGAAAYPPLLREIAHPPPLLFVHGQLAVLAAPQLAIVGARRASGAAREFARAVATTLAKAGIVVTSGLAAGIDAAAHRGALDGGGQTVAVFGCGIDRVYPTAHRALAAAVRAQGAAVSEFPYGAAPLAAHFPRRNRLIAGLALGTLVVEAALPSGSLSTAYHALEQGREVFAVPGAVGNPLSRGCHALLRQGAKLTESVADLAEELPLLRAALARAASTVPASADGADAVDGAARQLLELCGWQPSSIDDLALRGGLTVQAVSSILLRLELAGAVEARADGTYARVR